MSAALCLASLAGVLGAVHTTAGKCDYKYFTHYKEFGCQPVFDDSECPVKFNCDELRSRRLDRCYFDGREYSAGDQLGDLEYACLAECTCFEHEGRARFNCAEIECPEDFGDDLGGQQCRRLYKPEGCCADSFTCPNEKGSFEGVTCEYQDRTLIAGERFYPENECKVCTCRKGFDGELKEPWCKDILCGFEVRYHGSYSLDDCTPIYYKDGCCPIDRRCYQETDRVVPGEGGNSSTSAGACVFGPLRLSVGDKLSGDEACVDCACVLPPAVTCVQSC